MKKMIIALLVALLTFSAFACTKGTAPAADTNNTSDTQKPEAEPGQEVSEEPGNAPVAGGWQVPDEEMRASAEEAFRKATEGRVGYSYEMIECISYQIVAGVNFKIICRGKAVTPDAVSEIVLITVYSKLDGTAKSLTMSP